MTLLNVLLQAADGAAPGGFMNSSTTMIIMMVLLFAIMYFFMIRPQQKKQKQLQEQRNAIKTGDKVVTAGGIHGKVKEVGDSYFIVEIAEGTRIKIEKSSVYVSAADNQTNQ
ncbi:preprotein translocase subunit YajC [Dysgonomonas sp. PFB1-18]|uniref:preprotein translocase subunit YajC n=1 Tax=unclassified Dysgonomonas TaxID=2630389 RepID=UPI002473645A|nr:MULTISPECIES: preprotein translocase subunit YajC [unclassified Dysgonomonas]MDH6309237.1 preprotein translocase subunit YajC [Dysgonomonas sp. PF1-14]MDH6338883.1 preprotein translocase subunit YajC [Dysgonomonas sp. PF1-16]MDH6380486.1 preprotein translocase subunit YajC [Dysgonomonas sp. PFB1-18]MDH6397711.1 preprotein translocase subunit YajC [Dysgonomonas sp. PF1-23]